jgi:hypothetical protein
MEYQKLKAVTIRMLENDWELFKKVSKEKGSNASVEIRKFIKDYLVQNTDIIDKLLKNKGE